MAKRYKSRSFSELAKLFADEDAARVHLEEIRWKGQPFCPHCGCVGAYKLEAREGSARPGRKGLWKCAACRRQFTVTVGTIFESSRIPLNKWLYAIHLMCPSKKGVSANQLSRTLEITYKSAWFMYHRIRHAMGQQPLK